MNIDFKSKKLWVAVIIIFVFILLIISTASNMSKVSQKDEELSSLKTDIEDQQNEINKQKEEIDKKDTEIADLKKKVDEAAPWFELSEKEKQRKIDEEKAKEEAEKAAAEKKKKEEEEKEAAAEAKAKKEAEEKEKQGYDTGITYDQIARTPDDFFGEKLKFSGSVTQVMEGDGVVQIRFAIDDDYDKMILAEFDSSIVESRILEDDTITIMGTSAGLYTYTSTMGAEITIPSVLIDKIDQ